MSAGFASAMPTDGEGLAAGKLVAAGGGVFMAKPDASGLGVAGNWWERGLREKPSPAAVKPLGYPLAIGLDAVPFTLKVLGKSYEVTRD